MNDSVYTTVEQVPPLYWFSRTLGCTIIHYNANFDDDEMTPYNADFDGDYMILYDNTLNLPVIKR